MLTWLRRQRLVRGWGWGRENSFRFGHQKNHSVLGCLQCRHCLLMRYVLQVFLTLRHFSKRQVYGQVHDWLRIQCSAIYSGFNLGGIHFKFLHFSGYLNLKFEYFLKIKYSIPLKIENFEFFTLEFSISTRISEKLWIWKCRIVNFAIF